MKCAELSASAGSAAERNLSNGAPAAPRAVGRGEINEVCGAFGVSRKRSGAEFIKWGPRRAPRGGERRNKWSGRSFRRQPEAQRNVIYFDEIQLSSEGFARNFFSRSMSSGRILPSSAATSQTASKLDRE